MHFHTYESINTLLKTGISTQSLQLDICLKRASLTGGFSRFSQFYPVFKHQFIIESCERNSRCSPQGEVACRCLKLSLTPLFWNVCFLLQWRGRGSSHLSREKWRPVIGGYSDTSGEISYRPRPSLAAGSSTSPATTSLFCVYTGHFSHR